MSWRFSIPSNSPISGRESHRRAGNSKRRAGPSQQAPCRPLFLRVKRPRRYIETHVKTVRTICAATTAWSMTRKTGLIDAKGRKRQVVGPKSTHLRRMHRLRAPSQGRMSLPHKSSGLKTCATWPEGTGVTTESAETQTLFTQSRKTLEGMFPVSFRHEAKADAKGKDAESVGRVSRPGRYGGLDSERAERATRRVWPDDGRVSPAGDAVPRRAGDHRHGRREARAQSPEYAPHHP